MPNQSIGERLRLPWSHAPIKRFWAEMYCFALVFWFHADNHDGRKAITLVVVLVWAAIELGAAFGYANLPSEFFFLRIVVGIVVGRMWGIQITNVAGVELGYKGTDDKDDSDE